MTPVEEERRVERFDAVTEDPGEIHELTRAMFGTSGRVERIDGRPASLRLAHAAVAELGVQRVTWNVDGFCAAAPLDRFVCIRLLRGACGLDQGDGQVQYVQGDTFLIDPGRPVDVAVIGADLNFLTIERSALAAVAAQIDPRAHGRLDFRQAVPVTAALAHAWDGVLEEMGRVLRHDDLIASNDLVRAGLLYRIAATACAAFGLIREDTPERPVAARSLRRAVAFIEQHLVDPITVGDIAAAVGVSTRGLNDAFHRVLATTPHAYQRRARLDAVRNDLLHAEPDDSVRSIALRWGFHHLGRFADSYRREFGELPSRTLHA